MSNFQLQNQVGNRRVLASPEDIKHTVNLNHSISKVSKGKNKLDIVRANVTVQREYPIDTDCGSCKIHNNASCRIEFTVPLGLSTDAVADFKATVYEVCKSFMDKEISTGALRGFMQTPQVEVPERVLKLVANKPSGQNAV